MLHTQHFSFNYVSTLNTLHLTIAPHSLFYNITLLLHTPQSLYNWLLLHTFYFTLDYYSTRNYWSTFKILILHQCSILHTLHLTINSNFTIFTKKNSLEYLHCLLDYCFKFYIVYLNIAYQSILYNWPFALHSKLCDIRLCVCCVCHFLHFLYVLLIPFTKVQRQNNQLQKYSLGESNQRSLVSDLIILAHKWSKSAAWIFLFLFFCHSLLIDPGQDRQQHPTVHSGGVSRIPFLSPSDHLPFTFRSTVFNCFQPYSTVSSRFQPI